MAERKKKDESLSATESEVMVPVQVGMDKDARAKAETQNRQVGVDDSKDVREKLKDAAEDHSTTVEIPASGPLPEAARQAIADQDKDEPEVPTYDPDDKGVHTVTLDGKPYTWRDGEEKSVPKEALAVYQRAMDANNQ